MLIQFNADTQVRYAVLSPLNGLVPVVEPEVMEGTHGVILTGMFLKPSMVVAGLQAGRK